MAEDDPISLPANVRAMTEQMPFTRQHPCHLGGPGLLAFLQAHR